MRNIAIVIAVLSVAAACHAGPATVVDGDTVATVLLRAGHAGDEIVAAREMVATVAEMTGRVMPIVVEDGSRCETLNQATMKFDRTPVFDIAEPIIHLGRTEYVEENMAAELDALDQDGFIIRGVDGDLVLAGPTPWASGFATYAFLEDHCGVRWYLPGEVGRVIPQREQLAFEELDDTQEPAFLMRKFSGTSISIPNRFGRPLSTAWEEQNRLRTRFRFHHNLYQVLNPEVYGAEHPDWYPFIDGRRRPPKKNSSAGWQPCMTSEGGIDQIIANIIQYFDENPEANSQSIAPNDGGGYCNCPECLKLSENVGGEGGTEENRSRLFWQFANRIAEGVAVKYPDKIIGTLAYSYSKYPYEGLELHPNIMPFYVGSTACYRDPEAKAERLEHIDQWSKIARQMGIYEWYFGTGYAIPVPYNRFLAQSLQYSYEHGARAVYSEVYPNWGLDGYKVWVFSKLLWDPSRDVEELLEDFCTNYFAEAAEPMRKYIDLCERLGQERVVTTDPETGKDRWYFFRSPDQFLRWPADVVFEAEGYLNEARAAAKRGSTRAHVDYMADAFGVTKILSERYHSATEAAPLAGNLETMGKALSLMGGLTGPEMNLDLYTKWVLRDPWQIREPSEGIHGSVTLAKSALAGAITNEAWARVRGMANPTPADFRAAIASVAADALGGREPSLEENAVLDEVLYSAGRVALAHRIAKAPVVDGRLDDDCWVEDAAGKPVTAQSGFFVLQKGSAAAFTTEFRMVHDGRRLYVAARCDQVKDERYDEYYVSASGRDGRVWSDDSVELLLNLPEATDPAEYFQVIANTEPTPDLFDMLNKDASYDGDIEAAVMRIPGEGWKIELSVDLAEIGVDPARDRFLKMNFVRNVIGARDYLETSNWFPTHYANGDLESRGWLILQ